MLLLDGTLQLGVYVCVFLDLQKALIIIIAIIY
jgi:hypothetical protein